MNIQISSTDCQAIVEKLAHLLADTYTLYLKTQNIHWNIIGPNFYALHQMFEEQYQLLAKAVDEIAERIRALGLPSPGSYAEFARLSSIKEAVGAQKKEQEALTELLADHEQILHTARAVIPVAESANDEATLDLIAERLAEHEKLAWMLRSSLM